MAKLLAAFHKLIDGGGSLLVIEHNLDVIKCADWVIDMGPEGGSGGGQIVATGTPEEIVKVKASHTGHWLAKVLDGRIAAQAGGCVRNRCMLFTALFVVAASAGVAQQLPPGTHSVDDHSQQNAVSQQISEAESSLEKQDYKTAEAKLKVLAAADPKDGRVQYDLGFAEERNGEEADAAKAYAAAIAAMPEFAEPKVALGLLDARAGQH